MRLDKFLKVSGLVKRRTSAALMVKDKRVYLNGKEAKPSSKVKKGDVVKLLLPYTVRTFRVLECKNDRECVRVEEC